MLSSVVLTLRAETAGRLAVNNGHLAHGAWFHLCERRWPQCAARWHGNRRHKPFRLGMVRPRGRPPGGGSLAVQPGGLFEWRVRGLTEEVAQCLWQLAPDSEAVRLGQVSFALAQVARDPADHPGAGSVAWRELWQRWRQATRLPRQHGLRFLSPTTFRVDHWELPLPTPELVFASLLHTWNALAPAADLQLTSDSAEADVVSRFITVNRWRGRSVSIRTGAGPHGRPVYAFTGEFGYYVLEPLPQLLALVATLIDFAPFAGVGYQTTRGMGEVELVRAGR